jgi:methylated-DNA-protein-cysteine methyltransferase related protein
MTPFQQTVYNVVQLVPPGMVVSYGQVAAYIGAPRAARQVGWAMRSMEGEPDFPWWRVINNAGKITIKGNQFATAKLQKELLQAEGVEVNNEYELDIARYRFRADAAMLAKLRLEPEYVTSVLTRYGIG